MAKLKIKKNDVWIDMTPMSDVMVLLLTFFMLSANFVKNETVKVKTPESTNVDKVPATATLDIMIAPDTLKAKNGQDSIVGRVYLATDKVSTMDSALYQFMLTEPTLLDDKTPAIHNISKVAKVMNARKAGEKKELTEDAKKYQKLFLAETQIGIPLSGMVEFLEKSHEDKAKLMKAYGVPLDSINGGPSEFQLWVQALKKGYSMWYKNLEKQKEDGKQIDVDLDRTPKKLEICIKADEKTPYVTFKTVISELQDIMESRYKLVTRYKKEKED